jgi:hypothetical protein
MTADGKKEGIVVFHVEYMDGVSNVEGHSLTDKFRPAQATSGDGPANGSYPILPDCKVHTCRNPDITRMPSP